ncbi:hypothetical protein GGQ96_003354 [Sphingomonas abaci]|jgi:hypothetical protein|uniref:Uncharacterized protein n=1 Tax=Sphingomonas abaci TaxID=237611 RepID=A0A7W7EZF6_9SPHN|nr:hypothetical protein [Sphingomonas sp. BK481]MBB4619201.1 hypothetical protein [Sphingomonas abaci]
MCYALWHNVTHSENRRKPRFLRVTMWHDFEAQINERLE